MPIAIQIENVSKLYRLGTVGTGTIAHDLNRWWHLLRGKDDPYAKIAGINYRTTTNKMNSESRTKSLEYVWALKDINLEIEQGKILGIIGKNGAGKSSLLKLLSRVTAPSTGTIRTKGRIASLLEVGTGFHPELTGRENIYLNGAILGMTKLEISKKFDQIVEFSGCSRYIDTPVKRYSSGMTVRLGFSVAAHLQCEIMIVDEVLAVGDQEFQKRCLGAMSQVSKSGRTILFVSHNLATMQRLCNELAWMENGQIREIGKPETICQNYLCDSPDTKGMNYSFSTNATYDLEFINARFVSDPHQSNNIFRSDQPIQIEISYQLKKPLCGTSISVNICTADGESLWAVSDLDHYPDLFEERTPGAWKFRCTLPSQCLKPARYLVALGAGDGTNFYHHPEPFPFEITLEGHWRKSLSLFGLPGGPLTTPIALTRPQPIAW